MNKTLVVFRKFEGEVTALFPFEPGSNNAYDMACYSHVGQHSTAGMLWVRKTKPAKLIESISLITELRQKGYKMKFGQRIPRNALEVRRKKLTA